MKTTAKILPALIVVVSVCGIAHADGPKYTITDLGAIPESWSKPSINTEGVLAGSSASGFVYNYSDGSSNNLGTLGGGATYASGINATNIVVGSSYLGGSTYLHAFYYDTAIHDLGTLGGNFSSALAINSQNQIVGGSTLTPGYSQSQHAFLYSNGTMQDLGTLGGADSEANAINDSGIIVGQATTASGQTHAFMYDGLMHDLGALTPGNNASYATGISANGLIVGSSSTFSGGSHAFFYDGTMHDLGTLTGGFESSAIAVNSKGWVIGTSISNGSSPRTFSSTNFLYDGSKMYDIDALFNDPSNEVQLSTLLNISDTGNIFALGGGANGNHLYELNLNLSQVPIPASAWLFGSCLTALVSLTRKLKKS